MKVNAEPPIFDKSYMMKREHISWRGPIIADAICSLMPLRSVMDFGCATGDIVIALDEIGIDAWGVDCSAYAMQHLRKERRIFCRLQSIADFLYSAWPNLLPIKEFPADLGILLEVLSVIPDEDDRVEILKNVTRLSKSLIVNHLTPPERELMRRWNWDFNTTLTGQLKHFLEPWRGKQAMKALYLTGEIWDRLK